MLTSAGDSGSVVIELEGHHKSKLFHLLGQVSSVQFSSVQFSSVQFEPSHVIYLRSIVTGGTFMKVTIYIKNS
jgi:hypothetical protein